MLKIGVTAGIGSGKSTVCRYFEEVFHIPVYYMDERSKALVTEKTLLRVDLSEHFGDETFINGVYNTKYISNIVFNNVEERKWLEHKIGEYMKVDYAEWLFACSKIKKGTIPYVMVESAIFFEANCADMVDYILGVECPYAIRLERVQKRNNFTTEQVTERMKNQMDEDEKMSMCDFHVLNGDIPLADLNFQLVSYESLFRKMGKKVKETEQYYKNLAAKGVAFGLGVGQSYVKTFTDLEKFGGKEPDAKFVLDTVNSFFAEYVDVVPSK